MIYPAMQALAGAHPRSRGENDSKDSFTPPIAGASPLTRGKRAARQSRRAWTGRIPAHAGKTAINSLGAGIAEGASPLTRGKRGSGSRSLRTGGRIPAHAGKTQVLHLPLDPERAHPRSRGENPR